MRIRDVQRRATRARPSIRGFILAIAALVSVGCNTCLDASSVTLDPVPSDVGVDTPFDTSMDLADVGPDAADPSDAGLDLADDVGPDACVPMSSDQICEDLERFCGEAETVDNCGEEREVRCGSCDSTSSQCERGRCECFDGWRSVDDGARCVDVDECDIGTDDCDEGVNCTNLPGSFQCSSCPSGYLDVNGDGSECVDIDECTNGSAACDTLVSCNNLDGSYECGACPSGYDDVNGDGTDCQDIDECSLGNDNCDPNATCTDTNGGFDCTCNAGWAGDGTQCTLRLVTQVETYRATLDSGDRVTTVSLNETWDISQTVPFASVRLSGQATTEDAEFASAHPDVFLSGPSELTVTREAAGYDVRVVVTLTEFDSATTTVQQGSYSLDSVSTTAGLTSVDLGRSFSYFTTLADSADRYDELMTRGELSPSDLMLERGDGSDRVSGHWWVVEAEQQQFATQRDSGTIDAQMTCASFALTAVDSARTALLWSTTVNGNSDRVDSVYATCELQGSTNVECCRDTSGVEIGVALQVIEFDSDTDVAVERGNETLSVGDPLESSNLSMVRTRTMPLLGSSGILGVSRVDGLSARVADGMTTVDLNRTALSAEVERGSVDEPATTPWQVIHWAEVP